MTNQPKYYLGIDVSKPYFDLSLMREINHICQAMVTERFDNTLEEIKYFHQFLKKQDVQFDETTLLVIENTGVYHRLIWSFCSKYHLPLYIGNATHIKWSFGLVRGKNDVIDSKRLCNYAAKHADEIKATPALNPVLLELKDLMTARSTLLRQQVTLANYLKELRLFSDKKVQQILERSHKAALAGLRESLEEVETLIKKMVNQEQSIAKNFTLISSVPGIGYLTAIYILCCTNNFSGNITGKQLTSYAGVVPFEHSSRISVRGKSRVHRMANKELKTILYMCAMAAVKHYPEFRDYFERKKKEG